MATRINKYLSEVGYCSRRVADKLIEQGKVTINGEIPEMGTKVKEGDQVKVEGQIILKSSKQKNIYLAFNELPQKMIGISSFAASWIRLPIQFIFIGLAYWHSK